MQSCKAELCTWCCQALIYLLCKTYDYLCTCSTFKFWSRSHRGLLCFMGYNSCSLSRGDSVCLCVYVCVSSLPCTAMIKKKTKQKSFFSPLQLLSIYICLHHLGSFLSHWERRDLFQRVLSHTCNLRWELPSLSTNYNVWDPKPFTELSVMTNPFSTLHHFELKNKQCPACLIWLAKPTKGKNFPGWVKIRRNFFKKCLYSHKDLLFALQLKLSWVGSVHHHLYAAACRRRHLSSSV